MPSVKTNVDEFVDSARFKTTPVIYNTDVRSDCFSVSSDHVELVYMENDADGWCHAQVRDEHDAQQQFFL